MAMVEIFAPMDLIDSPGLAGTFLQPARTAVLKAHHQRRCPSIPDGEWVDNCILRCLHQEPSGRGFLQRLADREDRIIPSSTYFDAHATARRLSLLREVTEHVGQVWDAQAIGTGRDPFASQACLNGYDLFAGDGHYLAAATHDARIEGTRYAVGHFFGLNMRTHRLFHMAAGERGENRKREHDMRMLKRLTIDNLRRGAKNGRKVIWVWDRAGIDALQWIKWKNQHGVYFISRSKEHMKLEKCGDVDFDATDPVNRGVVSFTLVTVSSQILRCICYQEPVSGETYTFLTTLTAIPPGIVAALYKSRWDIEKVFDETKRKLGEAKSWGSSEEARSIQAESIALTHTLMLMLEQLMADVHGLGRGSCRDVSRRQQRLKRAAKAASKRGGLSPLVQACWLRATQRGLRFIRWLRSMLDRKASLKLAVTKLEGAWSVPRC